MNSAPLVYVAGPYTHPDPVENTHRAVQAATDLLDACGGPARVGVIVPHTSLLWHAIAPRPYDDWLLLDLHLLERCDLVWRLPGVSAGADGETAHARTLGIDVADLDLHRGLAFCRGWVNAWHAERDAESCAAPDCDAPTVYLGLCRAHAEEEVGPQYPDQADLIGPGA